MYCVGIIVYGWALDDHLPDELVTVVQEDYVESAYCRGFDLYWIGPKLAEVSFAGIPTLSNDHLIAQYQPSVEQREAFEKKRAQLPEHAQKCFADRYGEPTVHIMWVTS